MDERQNQEVEQSPRRAVFELTTFGHGGLIIDLDLNDNSAVQDVLDLDDSSLVPGIETLPGDLGLPDGQAGT